MPSTTFKAASGPASGTEARRKEQTQHKCHSKEFLLIPSSDHQSNAVDVSTNYLV
jgi:hypothetical protein